MKILGSWGLTALVLCLLLPIIVGKPQGYYYPKPSKPFIATATSTPKPNAEETTEPRVEPSTESLSEYIVEGKEEFLSLSQRFDASVVQIEDDVQKQPEIDAVNDVNVSPETSNNEEINEQTTQVTQTQETITSRMGNEEPGEELDKTETSTLDLLVGNVEPKAQLVEVTDRIESTSVTSAPYPPSGYLPSVSGTSSQFRDLDSISSSDEAQSNMSFDPRISADLEQESNDDEASRTMRVSQEGPYYYDPPSHRLELPQNRQQDRNSPLASTGRGFSGSSYVPARKDSFRSSYDLI